MKKTWIFVAVAAVVAYLAYLALKKPASPKSSNTVPPLSIPKQSNLISQIGSFAAGVLTNPSVDNAIAGALDGSSDPNADWA